MKKDNFYDEVNTVLGLEIKKNYDGNRETNLRNKVIFKYFVLVKEIKSIKKLFEIIKKYGKQYFVLGAGSNVLFSKTRYKNVIIKLCFKQSKYLEIVNSSDLVGYLNSIYLKKGINSLNFLTGVPCSIGGAIFMNAGAYNYKMEEIIEYVYAYDIDTNKIMVLNRFQCDFNYRKSIFQNGKYLILGAKLVLNYVDKEKLKKEHHQYVLLRKEKLPLEYPNLGSVFKNGSNYIAARLIDSLGLKGKTKGGAMVSFKHANVIVNLGKMNGKDFVKLIHYIKNRVNHEFKVKLEEEIIIL